MKADILIVEDDRSMCEMLQSDLASRGYRATWYERAREAFDDLLTGNYDAVLADLNLPEMNGIQFCERVSANRSDIPVIVMTAFGSLETAIAAIRAGAYDFLTKPFDTDLLDIVLRRAIEHHRLKDEIGQLRETASGHDRFPGLLGKSRAMSSLFSLMSRTTETDVSVLITGETGTGKEMVAKALHSRSSRKEGPFVPVDCSSLPAHLLESELFGHRRGAFTGAHENRTGLLLKANEGTLFLDEIGDMPLDLQPKLLRALEEREVRAVGSDERTPFDARVLSATNRDMEREIEAGRFREDLYYRLNVVHIDIPPLRQRGTDVLLLAQHFVSVFSQRSGRQITGLSDEAMRKLMEYSWPGNVRELRNAMERSVALARMEKIIVEDLPEKIRSYTQDSFAFGGDELSGIAPLEEIERRYIRFVLNRTGNNRSCAARILGLDRKTLYRKLQQYHMED